MIFVARILDGITGANLSTVQSAISDATTEKTRAQGLGLVGAAYGLGFVVGPLISGVVLRLANNDYSAPAFVAAGFALLSVILTLFVFRESLPAERRGVQTRERLGFERVFKGLRSEELAPLYLLAFAVQFIFAMFTASFALFTLNRIGFSSVDNAIFFGIFGILLVLMQGVFVGRWVRRYGEQRVLLVSFVLTAVGFGVATFTPQQAVPWYSEAAMVAELTQQGIVSSQLDLLPSDLGKGVGAFLFILFGLLPGPLGFTLQLPTINTLITKNVAPTEIGSALGVSATFVGAGSVVGPLLSGYLFEQIAPGAPFAVNALLSLCLLVLLMSMRRTIGRGHQQNVAASN